MTKLLIAAVLAAFAFNVQAKGGKGFGKPTTTKMTPATYQKADKAFDKKWANFEKKEDAAAAKK